MQDKSSVMLRLLLNSYHKGNQDDVLKLLPEEISKKVSELSIQSSDFQAAMTAPLDLLKTVHYSWLTPKLKELPKNTLPLILSLLPDPQATKLKNNLSIKGNLPEFSPKMRTFVLQQVSHLIDIDEALPLAFLPRSDMTELSELKKRQLVELIDYLGLFDLSQELHHIVDKKVLENVYSSLTPIKQVFLKNLLQSKEKLVTNRLNLDNWDGSQEKLLKILHHRGMVRLGYALSGQHPDLNWHITHILDTGRGEKLLRYINEKEIPGVTTTLKEQIQSVLMFFKKVSKK